MERILSDRARLIRSVHPVKRSAFLGFVGGQGRAWSGILPGWLRNRTRKRQQRERIMSVEKTLEKLLRGESDTNIRFDELCHLLQSRGFRMRVSGSHHIFTQTGVMERINLQREGSKAKPYQVRQVRKILANYKLL
jgi:predicted RNA binding protein YcfA (HicA-like mRNA interferase family)